MSAVPCNRIPCTAALIQQCILEHMNRDAHLMRCTRARWYLHYSTIMGDNGERPIADSVPERVTFSACLSNNNNDSRGCAERNITCDFAWRDTRNWFGLWYLEVSCDLWRFPCALSSKIFLCTLRYLCAFHVSLSGEGFVWSRDCNFYRNMNPLPSRFVRGWFVLWLKWCYENIYEIYHNIQNLEEERKREKENIIEIYYLKIKNFS